VAAELAPGVEESSHRHPALEPGERQISVADGVLLGWQARTVIIWWIPGLVFIALSQVQFRSWPVTIALTVFCLGLFWFYAADREVRPRSNRKQYVLTSARLWIGRSGDPGEWREVALGDVASTVMETGFADNAVRKLSGAATIVLVFRAPGPKGEPRRLRIGPLRRPTEFRAAIDAQLTMFERRF
jgi:hypothetical protein